MNDALFEEQVASVCEGGTILRGEAPALCRFEFQPFQVKLIRDEHGLIREK